MVLRHFQIVKGIGDNNLYLNEEYQHGKFLNQRLINTETAVN
jgi:hypothetical protein